MPRRDVFDLLPKNAGVEKKFSLGVVSGGLRGLVADCDVEQGQVPRAQLSMDIDLINSSYSSTYRAINSVYCVQLQKL